MAQFKVATLFLFAICLVARVLGAPTVTCDPDKITISFTQSDWGTADQKYYVTTDASPCIGTQTGTLNEAHTLEISFNGGMACITDSSTIIDAGTNQVTANGDITGTIYWRYAGDGFQTADDKEGTFTCTYAMSELSFAATETHPGTFSFNDDASDDATQTGTITDNTSTMKFYKYDTTSPTEVLQGSPATFDDKICVVIKTTNAAFSDVNIKTLTFADATDSTNNKFEYFTDFCKATSSPLLVLFDGESHTGADCAGNTALIDNCNKQRSVCFKPFLWAANKETGGTNAPSNQLFVSALATLATTTGFTDACANSNDAVAGRKKRDIQDEEEVLAFKTLVPIVKDALAIAKNVNGQMQTCETTSYLIAIIVLATAFVFSAIVSIFAFRYPCKNTKVEAFA